MPSVDFANQRKFAQDCNGAVAPFFGFMIVVLLITIGGAVDFGRWLHSRNATISAMDAAVLAAGRRLQIDSKDRDGAVASAQAFYRENTKSRLPLETDTITFEVSSDGLSVSAKGNASIETTFLHFVKIDSLLLLDASGTDLSRSEIETGKHSKTNVEVSIMLDVTGSMSGSKLQSMKEAAKELVDITIWDDQSKHTSKVALVPFSHAVNVGGTYFNAITDRNTASTLSYNSHPARPESKQRATSKTTILAAMDLIKEFKFVRPAMAASNAPSIQEELQMMPAGISHSPANALQGRSSSGPPSYDPCVVGRDGLQYATDDAPDSGGFFGVFDIKKKSNSWTKYAPCRPSEVAVQPLTNNSELLNDKIDSLTASGATAGHLGTAFTWYMLSPKWANIWPAESKPAPYGDSKTKKHAVLLTDGDYNIWYNANSNGDSVQQAEELCTNMKAEGITVFAVAFALSNNSSTKEVLENCATDKGKYHEPDDGEGLKQAFRSIALDITSLHLSY